MGWLTDSRGAAEGYRSACSELKVCGVGDRKALAKGLVVTIRGDCLRGQASMWRCRGARLEGKAKMGESRGLGRRCEEAIAGRLKFCIFVRCLSNSTPTNPPTEGGCSSPNGERTRARSVSNLYDLVAAVWSSRGGMDRGFV